MVVPRSKQKGDIWENWYLWFDKYSNPDFDHNSILIIELLEVNEIGSFFLGALVAAIEVVTDK